MSSSLNPNSRSSEQEISALTTGAYITALGVLSYSNFRQRI